MTPKNDRISEHFRAHQKVISSTLDLLQNEIYETGKLLANALDSGATLFWCGNGGSASDSQHLAAELVGRFKNNRKALRSIALTTDTSVLTCIANDFSYDDVFSRQVEALARPGDVLIGISTSGQSENILRAFRVSKAMGVTTIALLGKGGGSAKSMTDYTLIVPSDSTARIQETHILIGHILCELIEQELGLA